MTTRKLDFSIKSPQERKELVDKIIAEADPAQLTPSYMEILSTYLVLPTEKDDKKNILTDNRLVTIKKRETSFEGLVDKLESGEDGIYALLSNLGKNTKLTQKDTITEEDLQNIAELRQLKDDLAALEKECQKATGKKKYFLKKWIIELRQQQYIIKNIFYNKKTFSNASSTAKSLAKLQFDDDIYLDNAGVPQNRGLISFFNPKHIEALLCNYGGLKAVSEGKFEYDLWYLMQDLDKLIKDALENFPVYLDITKMKIAGYTNVEIQAFLISCHDTYHTPEYISSLWRQKIPKIIAETAQRQYLYWYYSSRPKEWKTCNRCGERKPRNNYFYSLNKGSKDGYYSLCKECRKKQTIKKRKD